MLKLPLEFYNRNVVEVAKDLIGKRIVFDEFEGIITETEAYGGYDDEASHAFRGITKRSGIMFGPPGYTYVYLIYGMYHCLNIVAEEEGLAGAVLIRGIKLSYIPKQTKIQDFGPALKHNDLRIPLSPGHQLFGYIHLDGPGKACRYLGITKAHNGLNLVNNKRIYLTEGLKNPHYLETPRIGIKKATDKPWRFMLK